MKADFYAKKFMEIFEEKKKEESAHEAFIQTIIEINQLLIAEVYEIGKKRGANCIAAWDAVIKEQNQKWQAIVRRLPTNFALDLNAFERIWEAFKDQRKLK